MSEQTSDRRWLRFLCVVDEFTRECRAVAVRQSFRAKDVIAVMAGLIAHLRSDKGPEFVAPPVQAWLKSHLVRPLYISPKAVRGRTRMCSRSKADCAMNIRTMRDFPPCSRRRHIRVVLVPVLIQFCCAKEIREEQQANAANYFGQGILLRLGRRAEKWIKAACLEWLKLKDPH